jgi:hypothetical protein
VISYYDWPGGREAMLRFGPADGPVVVAALPLFEEANRTRTFVVTILRMLAARGIASALPDLPGTGESLVPTEATTILDMQNAFRCAVEAVHSPYLVGLRAGALLDTLALTRGRWHFAPVDGPQLLRELTRIRQAAMGGGALPPEWWFDAGLPEDVPEGVPVEIAGNLLSVDLLTELTVKGLFEPAEGLPPLRTVRLESDPRPADLQLPGAPLWRRAEPDNDLALAALLADDIAEWVRAWEDRLADACEG